MVSGMAISPNARVHGSSRRPMPLRLLPISDLVFSS